jgi:superfamily I DNA and/or RNA helicase
MNKILSYWRRSLIDGSRSSAFISDSDSLGKEVDFNDFREGVLSKDKYNNILPTAINKKKSFTVRTWIYTKNRTYQYGKKFSSGSKFALIILAVDVDTNGKLTLSIPPYIPRDILSPMDDVTTPFVGSVEDFDKFIDDIELDQSDWVSVMKFFDDLHSRFEKNVDKNFSGKQSVFFKEETNVMAGAVIKLYDYLISNKQSQNSIKGTAAASVISLADGYVNGVQFDETKDVLNLTSSHKLMSARLGSMEYRYPLATAQRDALSHYLLIGNGETLAVNGPPGTGKTTLLQSIVATEVVNSAIAGIRPALIIACSTNNNAITNIIKSFGEIGQRENDTLSGRWIPQFHSLASYNAKKSDENKAFLIYDELANLEAFDFGRLEQEFTQRASGHFGTPMNLDQILERLHKEVVDLSNRLEGIAKSVIAYHDALREYHSESECFGQDLKTAYLIMLRSQWQLNILDFILLIFKPSMVLNKVNRLLSSSGCSCQVHNKTELRSLLQRLDFLIQQGARLDRFKNEILKDNSLSASILSESLENIDASLDNTIRYDLFNLAVHYWEGRFLQVIREQSNNEFSVKERLRIVSMITPCIVSTFHRVPILLRDQVPFVGEADLLIVDEAGQVTPEIAMAAFSLAKKAIVVGDTLQIKPVWSVPKEVDKANIADSLSFNAQGFESFITSGLAASQGSVMEIAQKVSPFWYEENLARGMYLLEHRRCNDDIISYCNALCYKGYLIPMKGNPATLFPSMAYVDVPQGLEEKEGTSRCNPIEASAIVAWIVNERNKIEAHYGKMIGDVVAVITPFKAQAKSISELLKAALGKEVAESIVVGTVHSLQGAERSIVLFSMVYAKKAGYFFDKSPNILNVAVSRAKDSFIAFGNHDLFNNGSSNASARLYERLTSELPLPISDHIHEVIHQSFDAGYQANTRMILTLAEHDKFLEDVLNRATGSIIIISPWVSGYVLKKYAEMIKEALARGVAITVYTDQQKNSEKHNVISDYQQLGVKIRLAKNLHSKNIIVDDKAVTFGSFNWLSAQRKDSELTPVQTDYTTIVSHSRNPEGMKVLIDSVIDLVRVVSEDSSLST